MPAALKQCLSDGPEEPAIYLHPNSDSEHHPHAGVRCLEVSYNRCLRSVARIGRNNPLSNSQVRNRILGAGS